MVTKSEDDCLARMLKVFIEYKHCQHSFAKKVRSHRDVYSAIRSSRIDLISRDKAFKIFSVIFEDSQDDFADIIFRLSLNSKCNEFLIANNSYDSMLTLEEHSPRLSIFNRKNFESKQIQSLLVKKRSDAGIFLYYSFLTFLVLVTDYVLDQICNQAIIEDEDIDLEQLLSEAVLQRLKKKGGNGRIVSRNIGPAIDYSFDKEICADVNLVLKRSLNVSKVAVSFRKYLRSLQHDSSSFCATNLHGKNIKLAIQCYFIESCYSYFELKANHSGNRHMRDWSIPLNAINFFFPEYNIDSIETLKKNSRIGEKKNSIFKDFSEIYI